MAPLVNRAGVSCIIAPYEADFQLALLHSEGVTDFTMSRDQDMVIFGINRIVTKWGLTLGTASFFCLHGGLSIASSQAGVSELEKLLAPLSTTQRTRASVCWPFVPAVTTFI